MESSYNINSQVSYLQARDPTITVNNKLSEVKINLEEKFQTDGHIQVHLRIKKIQNNHKELYEIVDENTLLCNAPKDAQCMRNVRDGNSVKKTFKFSKIFGPNCLQNDLFNNAVKAKMLQFINGYNYSLLTYGASGSGKTFTIVGTAEKPGIIPRSLEYLFRTLPTLAELPVIKPTVTDGVVYLSDAESLQEQLLKENLLKRFSSDSGLHARTYKAMQQRLSCEPVASIVENLSDVNLNVWVSFAEIYNEFIYDLLQPELLRGQVRQKLRLGYTNNCTYIKDLTSVNVSSGLEAYQILQYGLHNLNYASTSLNDHSSRSHSIFTIKLVQSSNKSTGVGVSKFNFCDLAGSERVKKTNNVGQRLKESNNINTSLLVLGRCMNLVRQSQKNHDKRLIPFRESKLTQLFQNALLGHEAISLIVNISPSRVMFDETQHALNFSAIAKNIIIEQQPTVKLIHHNKFLQYIDNGNDNVENTYDPDVENLEEQIVTLRTKLEQQKLEAAIDREHLLSSYKTILAETNSFWEKRIKNLLIVDTEELQEHINKKRKMSVIVLDSSSEDLDVTDSSLERSINLNRNKIKDIKLQEELIHLKNELNTKEEENEKLLKENKNLQCTLEDAKSTHYELTAKYENDMKEYTTEIIRQQEKINELNFNICALNNERGGAGEFKDIIPSFTIPLIS